MNMRLVVVWAAAIVLFAAAGLFGYVVKDTQIDEDRYKDIIQDEVDYVEHVCSGKNSNANISYIFQVKSDNLIKKMSISYQTLLSSPKLDSSAESLKGHNASGIESAYNFDSEHRFKLSVTITPSLLSEQTLSIIKDDVDTLGILVKNETNFDEYVNSIKKLGSYTCN